MSSFFSSFYFLNGFLINTNFVQMVHGDCLIHFVFFSFLRTDPKGGQKIKNVGSVVCVCECQCWRRLHPPSSSSVPDYLVSIFFVPLHSFFQLLKHSLNSSKWLSSTLLTLSVPPLNFVDLTC